MRNLKPAQRSFRNYVFKSFVCILICAFGIILFPQKAYGSDIAIDANTFPDQVFRDHIAQEYDTNSDGFLSADEIANVVEIVLSNKRVQSVEGIKVFTSCETLYLHASYVLSADLSNMTSLVTLYITYTPVSSINVSGCSALKDFYCFRNYQLVSLEVGGCTSLELLRTYDDYNLAKLDVSTNVSLRELSIGDTKIVDIDVSQNKKLEVLYCESIDPSLTQSPDVSQNPELRELHVSFNEKLSFVDVSHNPKLEKLSAVYCDVSFVDVTNNPELRLLSVNGNHITELDLSKNPKLSDLSCNKNELSSLDLSYNPELYRLSCSTNNLSVLDLTNNLELYNFDCYSNQLTTLDFGYKPKLNAFACQNNKLTTLDLTGAPNLGWTSNCSNNQIEEITFSSTKQLQGLRCQNNRLLNLTIPDSDRIFYNDSLDFTGQTRTILFVSDGEGGYISKNTYQILDPHFSFSSASYDPVSGYIKTSELGVTDFSSLVDIPQATPGYPYYLSGNLSFASENHSVVFLGYDREVLSTQIVKDGSSAVAPDVSEFEGYRFLGWDSDFSSITTSCYIQALYEKIAPPSVFEPDSNIDEQVSEKALPMVADNLSNLIAFPCLGIFSSSMILVFLYRKWTHPG